jgi:hypothetical protein
VNSPSKTPKKVIKKAALAHGHFVGIARKKERFQRNPPSPQWLYEFAGKDTIHLMPQKTKESSFPVPACRDLVVVSCGDTRHASSEGASIDFQGECTVRLQNLPRRQMSNCREL